jgi:hypothetical protein
MLKMLSVTTSFLSALDDSSNCSKCSKSLCLRQSSACRTQATNTWYRRCLNSWHKSYEQYTLFKIKDTITTYHNVGSTYHNEASDGYYLKP